MPNQHSGADYLLPDFGPSLRWHITDSVISDVGRAHVIDPLELSGFRFIARMVYESSDQNNAKRCVGEEGYFRLPDTRMCGV